MYILITFLLFIFLFLLPFLPGILELYRKEDAEPLFISMDYMRNPRYFGKSFKKLIHRATAGFTLSPGMREIHLSKPETVELAHSFKVSGNREITHMLYVIGELVSDRNVQFNKEVYSTDNTIIGPNNIVRALASDLDITVSEGVQFQRWLDAEGDIEVGANCNLGISASAGNKLSMGENCIFRRLFAMPITTGHNNMASDDRSELSAISNELLPSGLSFIRKKDSLVPPGTIIDNNVVFPQDVLIGQGATIRGHVKSYGQIVIEPGVTIDGNVFADGDIFVGQDVRIRGHLFSQMSIHISKQTVISLPDKIKSVIGKKSISIEKDVTIYGYLATEGEGKTL
jgi:predicted acyltransferase (DUF342 family)